MNKLATAPSATTKVTATAFEKQQQRVHNSTKEETTHIAIDGIHRREQNSKPCCPLQSKLSNKLVTTSMTDDGSNENVPQQPKCTMTYPTMVTKLINNESNEKFQRTTYRMMKMNVQQLKGC